MSSNQNHYSRSGTSPGSHYNLLKKSGGRLKQSISTGTSLYPSSGGLYPRTSSSGHSSISPTRSVGYGGQSPMLGPRKSSLGRSTSGGSSSGTPPPPPPTSPAFGNATRVAKYGKKSTGGGLEDDLPEENLREIERFIPSRPAVTEMPSIFPPPPGNLTSSSSPRQTSSSSSSRNHLSSSLSSSSYGNNQSSYGNNQSSYGNTQSSYGNTSSSYSNNQSSYGSNQSSYSNNQSSYSNNQSSYGNNQSSYGSNQSSYGSNQSSYGSNQSSYGNNNDTSHNGTGPHLVATNMGSNTPRHNSGGSIGGSMHTSSVGSVPSMSTMSSGGSLLSDFTDDATSSFHRQTSGSNTSVGMTSPPIRRKSALRTEGQAQPENRRQNSVRFNVENVPSSTGRATQPGAVSSTGADPAANKQDDPNNPLAGLTEEQQIQAAIRASQQQQQYEPSSSANMMMMDGELEEVKSIARNLRDAARQNDSHSSGGNVMESESMELLLSDCTQAQERIQNAIAAALDQGAEVVQLFELAEYLSDAIEEGKHALNGIKKRNSGPQLDVADLVEKKDIFTLICTLRSQNSVRLDATLALMRFARDAEGGDMEQVRLRDEIRSSGGMHSLLTVFASHNVMYDLKVVAAMAVSYLSPSFVEASEDIHANIALKIVECIRFLSRCREVRPNGELIGIDNTRAAAAASLAAFWMTYLGPKLNSDASTAIFTVENTPVGKRRGNEMSVDQRREKIALREVLEISVSLVIGIASQTQSSESSLALVEQVCAVEIARPLAVRDGILQVLVQWSEAQNPEFIRTATLSLRYLTSIKDSYMAGWIHSEMVNKGAVQALAKLTQHPTISHDVRLAIAQILASLCVAPHTRAAVVEANCIHFLVGFLYEPSSSSSAAEVILSAGSALVHLARGAITRAAIFDDDDRGEDDLSQQDRSRSLLDDILESGAVDRFVEITRARKDKLRSIAIEGLRILSEDVSTSRQTRLRLCKDGAAEALGCVLKDIISPISPKFHLKQAVMGLPMIEKKQLQEALCAVANILEQPQDSSRRKRRISQRLMMDAKEMLMKGCLDAADSGGLDSILKIMSFPFVVTAPVHASNGLNMLEEACRCLSSMAPHLLSPSVAEQGAAVRSQDVLNAMHGVLKELVNSLSNSRNPEAVKEATSELREVVLTTLRVLAQSEPLMIRIVDKTLPFLTKAMGGSEDGSGSSGSVSQVLQSLDFAEDEIVSQVAGNNPSLLADWFCIQRSLLIQAMARTEMRRVVVSTWEKCFNGTENKPGLTNLMRDTSEASRSDDSLILSANLFEHFANDENTLSRREMLIEQYNEIYGSAPHENHIRERESTGSGPNSQPDQSLLACQIYPLNSSHSESQWILEHGRSLATPLENVEGAVPQLSRHVNKLLNTCFPSAILKDQIAPVAALSPRASYNFRALMMPQRRYFSFQREAKLLSRICDKENATIEDDNVYSTLGFTNSSFDEEFAESLVNFLYLCPMIKGLSFSRNEKWEKIKNADKETQSSDGSNLVASLAGSLPPWISHLSYVDMLAEEDLGAIVSMLETVGKLSESQEGSSEVVAQAGKFSFLAISRTQYIGPDVWQRFFSLFSRGNAPTSSPRPLSSLKSLDLSFNNLGDDLCSRILELSLLDGSCHSLENLDLSGNNMRAATSVIRVLTAASRRTKTPLRVLKLCSNSLSNNGAWLHILVMFKAEAFRLRELDLSSNEIFLSTFDDAALFVGSILKYKALTRLGMSNNHIHPHAIDDILRRLKDEKEGSRECKIGFLEFENNDPPLTPEQIKLVQDFCGRSRRALFESVISEREQEEKKEEDVIDEDNEERFERIDDPPSIAFPDHTSLAPAESQVHDLPTPVESNNVITVLFSAPLVYRDGNKRFQPFKKLNFEMERELMWQCLKEASRDIELSFDNATSERLLATIAKRCSCLHYSGHGHKQLLPFENNAGGTDWFPVTKFKELIQNESSVPFRFVFVSACHSGLAGQTFASAGVPHVVCCQQEYELKDTAALAFTRQFYLALAVGNTVRDSFEQGCRAVRATPNLKDAEEEMKKFILLPEDGNHDVPIFNARPVREWPRVLSEEAKRYRRSNSTRGMNAGRRGSLPSVALRNLELNVRNLIQDDPSPTPPQFFLGREVEMYNVLNLVLRHRLISVVGEPGIGRSSLVCSLCHFLNERKNIVSTSIEKIYFVKTKKFKKRSRFGALIMSLLKRLTDEGKVKEVEDEDDKESVIEAICTGLKKIKALLVFDRVDLLDDTDDLTEFSMLLRELIRETNNVKILLTNKRPLGIPSLGEQHFSLGPLNFENTVKLFALLCPHVHRPGDRQKLIESLVQSREEAQLLPGPDTPEIFQFLFDKLGRGIPARIENAAFCFHKDELDSFKDGSFRDDF